MILQGPFEYGQYDTETASTVAIGSHKFIVCYFCIPLFLYYVTQICEKVESWIHANCEAQIIDFFQLPGTGSIIGSLLASRTSLNWLASYR